ncbi:redox-active disulfide protein 2 [Porphyromonas macacae]|jgi:small redox-active disulfide protein 2|uniref:Redox-active disulfide protein 2 n=4 Tax=Bacteroidales TaxID=171549 RepID=A0A0A2EBW4_9PORP|nr:MULTISPECIES: thioredoxin family protein [Bacteroidota]KGL51697.1 redox-active disulfide protein 2 [Porphyromonas canoris]KGL56644.1 redox-active disulfide protein 2 [Porphyromonas sp. COT-052 OH4946]KGN69832.1 redox-active disulfide protein 2 [Porphyromonas gulae]KGN71788.1 redox-active disulfide protein 2 [Porphyromonas sp. COT-108 OH1349]KGN76378.1 redox-active disulfide protein 2 [Porphyromonas macacae]
MEIIVLGTGCANCKTTYNRVAKVIADTNSKATLKKEEDILEIVKYNIMSLPAIVVDGEVKIKGYVPSEEEIKKLVTE